ncbi:MAG: GyrI-like domain-containing protein [Alphaproteobacteria bacterium]|nr:GyrI-like domain-containing protein [Alphaproteobacteria bacterium]
MTKIDFRKELKSFYAPPRAQFTLIKIPALRYLMLDGKGNPNTSASYVNALQALYGTAYTLKFFSKNELKKDYIVPPLEGLWWAKDMSAFKERKKDLWHWTMMLMVPEWIKPRQIDDAIDTLRQKKNPTSLDKLRHTTLTEGLSVQILHIGSYDDETPILAKLHNDFMPENKLTFNGKHHEIYLSDPRKTPDHKLKTILRQPVKPL